MTSPDKFDQRSFALTIAPSHLQMTNASKTQDTKRLMIIKRQTCDCIHKRTSAYKWMVAIMQMYVNVCFIFAKASQRIVLQCEQAGVA